MNSNQQRKNGSIKFNLNEKIFLTVLSIIVIFVFIDFYFLEDIRNKKTEGIPQTEELSFEIDQFWKDPEWKKEAIEYLEETGGYEPPQNNYTREQKKQYVRQLIGSLSKTDIRILNDYFGNFEGGYYFETTGHIDYPNKPEELQYIISNINEVIDLLSN